MSAPWNRTSSFDDASDEARDQRRQRVDRFLDRASQQGQYWHIPHKFGPTFNNQWLHGVIRDHDGPVSDEHWDHLPDDVVSLRQPIHQHQGFVYPEMVKEKVHELFDDGDLHDYGTSWGNEDPKFVRHEGKHYLLDGHHRYAKSRLLGQDSMWGKVFDTANPDHRQANCIDCHHRDADWDHDPDSCPTCKAHGW